MTRLDNIAGGALDRPKDTNLAIALARSEPTRFLMPRTRR